jgi:hypothetical protein
MNQDSKYQFIEIPRIGFPIDLFIPWKPLQNLGNLAPLLPFW